MNKHFAQNTLSNLIANYKAVFPLISFRCGSTPFDNNSYAILSYPLIHAHINVVFPVVSILNKESLFCMIFLNTLG